MKLTRRNVMLTASAAAIWPVQAQSAKPLKIGFIIPATGQFASTGRMLEAGARLYMQQNGDTVAGRKIELVVRDDTGVADTTKRIAQALVVNEGAEILAGFGLTPLALAVAPIATEAKVAQIVMMAATSIVTDRSPYIVRPCFTNAQTTAPLAEWSVKNGIKKVVTLVSDYAPGIDTETTFVNAFKANGGEIITSIRAPLPTRDFAPFLQRAADAKPDALFVFVPSGIGATLMKQFAERGLDKSGIRLIGEGSVTEDDTLTQMGDEAKGMITSHHYSAAHDSPENKAFIAAFRKANNNARPNLIAVHAYDGLHMIYEALKKTNGNAGGDGLVAAMKGMAWTSPRGPMKIDPDTRETIQNVYVRKVERVGGELYNVEFATIANATDPTKAKK
jgi:branched-chain amino acid transport system substrate-binding protein